MTKIYKLLEQQNCKDIAKIIIDYAFATPKSVAKKNMKKVMKELHYLKKEARSYESWDNGKKQTLASKIMYKIYSKRKMLREDDYDLPESYSQYLATGYLTGLNTLYEQYMYEAKYDPNMRKNIYKTNEKGNRVMICQNPFWAYYFNRN